MKFSHLQSDVDLRNFLTVNYGEISVSWTSNFLHFLTASRRARGLVEAKSKDAYKVSLQNLPITSGPSQKLHGIDILDIFVRQLDSHNAFMNDWLLQ